MWGVIALMAASCMACRAEGDMACPAAAAAAIGCMGCCTGMARLIGVSEPAAAEPRGSLPATRCRAELATGCPCGNCSSEGTPKPAASTAAARGDIGTLCCRSVCRPLTACTAPGAAGG